MDTGKKRKDKMNTQNKTELRKILNSFLQDIDTEAKLNPDVANAIVDIYLKKIEKNFVAKGEVREMIEDIQATEIADHSLASLIEKLYKYKKSLE